MKYEKHFNLAELDFEEIGFRCLSLEKIVERFASTYHREVDMSVIEAKKFDFLRNSVAMAMENGLDAFLADNPGMSRNLYVMADEVETFKDDDSINYVVKGYSVKSDKDEITLSIARDLFSRFDVDEFESVIEEEFLDAVMYAVKDMPSAVAKPTTLRPTTTETSADEIVESIVDAMPEIFKPSASKPTASVKPQKPTTMEQKPTPSVEETEQSASVAENIIDPNGLYKKYAANFADIMSVPDVQNAISNTFSREGNRIVLTSVMYDEDDGKVVTTVKYDAQYGGKTTRTIEHEGNRTRTYDWRTPSKFGEAMASLPEDGGEFDDDVLSRTLTKECCKKFGIRFIATPNSERNANRGRSGTSKQQAAEINGTAPKPIVEEVETVDVETPTVEIVEAEEVADAEPSVAEVAEVYPEAEEVEYEDVEVEAEAPSEVYGMNLVEAYANVCEAAVEEPVEVVAETEVVDAPKEKEETVAVSKPSLQGTMRCEQFAEILMWVKEDVPVYLCGPSGTGKDITCMQIAEELGLEFHCHNAVQNTFDVVGFTDARGVYHETELFQAWTKGGIISFTELDASDSQVLNIMNEALSNGYMVFEGKRYAKHPDCRIMASGNTCGTGATNLYTGRMRIDEATLGRFELIEVDYDSKVESSIAGDEIAEFAADFRAAAKECGIEIVRSYRQSKHLAIAMRSENFPRLYGRKAMEKAIDRCFRRYMSNDDFKMIALHCKAAKNTYTRTFRKMAEI